MSSSYQLCPALKLDDGYLVVRRVEKAYPVFLRCAAAYLPPSGPVLAEALDNIEVFPTLAEFSAAAARLVSQPMLQPFDGGVTVLVYVARPGKESLFLEFAEGLDQADDYRLLRTLPAVGAPLALVFGDPSVPLGEPSRAMPAAYASVDTAIGLKAISVIDQPPIVLPAADSPMPMDEAPAPLPDLSAILPDIPRPPLPLGDPLPPEYSSAFMAPDLQPLPPPEATGPAPLLDNEALPPMDVVMVTTSALDDVLGSSMAERGNAERPAGEPEALAYADPSEPALETLLRQAPRLQSPDTGPTPPASGELGRGPEPEELLTAVKQEVNTLAEALRRQGAEQQAGLQAAMAGAEQAARQQGRSLEARQAEQWDRQQTALRQMHADQAAAIQSAITRQDEERAAWQQQAQPVSGQQLPAALRQLQDDLTQSQQLALQQSRDDLTQSQQLALHQLRDDLTQSQQLALHQLRDDLRRQPPTVVAAAPAAPPPSAPAPAQPAITADLQELNWQLEKAAVATQDLRQRVGQLLWVNLFLILVLLGLVAAVAWALWGRAPSPAPRPTVALTATRVPATAVPPTQAPPTLPPSTATRLPTPTAAATALPVFVAALACANADRPRNFYDCVLTNTAKVTDTLSLAVQAAGDEFNGFRPSVSRESQENIQPDSLTGLFVVGEFAPGETQALRINLPCAVVTGCGETTFAFTPLVDRGQTLVANQVVEVTTHYFLP